MKNPKGCWLECTAAALALFCTLGLNINIFSVYIPYLTRLLGLSFHQNSGFLMVRNLFTLTAVYLAKFYYDKLDIRLGYSLAMLMNILGVFLYSAAESFTGLCIAAAVSGLSYGLGGMYPVAILIHRWFPVHEGLAMGICAASSGIALTVGAPVVTALIENHSLDFAMYCQMGFMLVCLVLCFCLLRNYPEGALHYTSRPKTKRHPFRISWMFFAIMAIGMLGGGFSYLTTHYTAEGFDPYRVSTIIAVLGLVLTGAKFLLGELLDLWGGYKTNWLFLPLAVLSCILFSLGSTVGYGVALTAGILYGIGDSVATVGISAYARDLSNPEEYSATQQQYQTASGIGSLVCTLIPGMIATATGNYRLFYLILAILMVFCTVVIQLTYAKRRRIR